MKIQFKIYNIDIIDCSSCYNSIFPNPETREVLLELILKIFESDIIYRIGSFKFWLDDIELQSPIVRGANAINNKRDDTRHKLQIGTEALLNKTEGLYVEQDVLERIIEPSHEGRQSLFKSKKSFYIESGLNGIKKAINYIKSLYNNQRDRLPTYLKDLNLKHFGFTGGVIWGMDKDWRKLKDGTISYINYENDNIGGSSTESGIEFTFGNFGGDSPDIYISEYYLDHLNAITSILDKIAPGKYIAGPDEMEHLLKYEILKKEGRKLIAGDEKKYEENLERYLMDSLVRDLGEDGVERFRKKYLALREKIEMGIKFTGYEEQEFQYLKNLLDEIEKNKKNKR